MLQRPHLTPRRIKVAFASGNAELNRELINRLAARSSELPLYVIGEFAPHTGEWIPWHVLRSLESNRASVAAALGDRQIALGMMALCRDVPLEPMRQMALLLARSNLTVIDEQLREFPASRLRLETIRRAASAIRRQLAPEGRTRKWLRRMLHPSEAEIPLRARLAQARGIAASKKTGATEDPPLPGVTPLAPGVTVVIPSRDGKELLATLLPNLVPQIVAGEIIVSDNGSMDDTAAWLTETYPAVRLLVSSAPLSFAQAVNAGISAARFEHVLLLNNDMVVEPEFVSSLSHAFSRETGVFSTTAQIFFPSGVRREETGKAVWRRDQELDLPLRCDEPLPGEDGTWVLYGSGGCSLCDTAKLRALGGVSLLYDPAYVEDLDLGYRAWKRGWPTLYCASARVEHRHRATTSRFYTQAQLDTLLERNYLAFLIHAIGDAGLFRKLWAEAIRRLQLRAMSGQEAALGALRTIPRITPRPTLSTQLREHEILALGNGDVAVFPGTAPSIDAGTILVASPFLPFPLSHGGAVRMFNLMKQAAAGWNQVLVAFADQLAPPPPELLALCREIIVVRRHHSHYRRQSERPDTVEDFDSLAFRAALKQTVRRWNPGVAQLEFTQMAQYADAAAPARTILIEHDITFDLAAQLAQTDPTWERQQQLEKWRKFETKSWSQVDAVVTMSEKDRQTASAGARMAVSLPNGVDTERFQPAKEAPEPKRLLFIGSFAHLPNLLALDFFLREVWPRLHQDKQPGRYKLHVIAGTRHDYYLDFFRRDAAPDLTQPGIEVEGFVSDVRPAYRKAALVVAPLVASAGTNIKVLEAMAMGRVVISTPAGINGLDLTREHGVAVGATAAELAALIEVFASQPELRREVEAAARRTAFSYDWRAIAQRQTELYKDLISGGR